MDQNDVAFMNGFYSDPAEFAQHLSKAIARGDFPDWRHRYLAKRVLKKAELEVRVARRLTPEGIAERQAIAAERQTVVAFWALFIAVLSLIVALATSLFKP